MRTTILKRAWGAFGQSHFVPQSRCVIVMLTLLLAAANLFAIPTGVSVTTLGGGNPNVRPKYFGYEDGTTLNQALFHSPCGIALDSTGQYLLLADRDNNAIRSLDLLAGFTWTFDVTYTNLINRPIAVAVDAFDFIYVLNRGNTNNGSVVTFDGWGDALITNAVKLTNATGMALDSFGNIYVTVKSNKLIRIDAYSTNQTAIATNFPAGTSLQGIVVKHNGLIAACDSGRNGIYLINPTNGIVSTNAGFHGAGDFTTNGNNVASSNTAKFYQPMNVVETGDGSLIVTDYGNNRVKRVLPSGVVTNFYGVALKYWGGSFPGWYDGAVQVPDSIAPNVQSRMPVGVALALDGTIYTTEDYYHIVRHVTGGSLVPPQTPAAPPTGLYATAGYGQVVLKWQAGSGATNYNIKRSLTSGGPYTNDTIGSTTATSYTDTSVVDGTTYYYVVSDVSAGGESANSSEASAIPMFSPAPTIFLPVTTNYGLVAFSWSVSAGATSYNIKRAQSTNGPFTTIANSATNSYNDTTVANGATYYYVVSALNPGGEGVSSSPPVEATVPLPPVPDPQIGYVDFPATANPMYSSVFHQVSSAIFYNDTLIVIKGTPLSSTYYTYGNTTNISGVSDPTIGSASVPSDYADGLTSVADVMPYVVVQEAPYLTVKAIAAKSDGSPNSAVVPATFQFITGNPNINGNNAAQFTISDITLNAQLYYTLNGTDPSPTNPAAIPLGTAPVPTNTTASVTNVWTVAFAINADTLFKIRAFRDPNYQPSAIVTNIFYYTNFAPNKISFGFAVGEASSAFVVSPGQTFYAPVTLTTLSGAVIDSLQFNLTVTNAGPSPGLAIAPGAFAFQSMLMKPDLDNPGFLMEIPPLMFIGNASDPPPTNQIVPYNHTNFVNLLTANISENLLGVGWLERQGQTNLFNTKSQDLIAMSLAHDDQFPDAAIGQPNGVILGGYSFLVPANALPGTTYQIQIGRPSATTDGIGEPGSSVFIYAPTNNDSLSLGAGSVNAVKIVTVGQRKYIAGDAAPFGWFNAGDFGNTNLDASDVAQVFEAAVYQLNSPAFQAPGSDLFDSMDSCGYTYVDNGNGYLQNSGTLANADNLWLAGDASIDQIAFGDGNLDVADVYVTYRRSLDPARVWFRRFWTNDVAKAFSGRAAEIVPNAYNPGVVSSPLIATKSPNKPNIGNSFISLTNQPKINFVAGDYQTIAGSTIQIPVTANIFGSYPLRVLMLNLSVVPLDGSPALTTAVAFSYNQVLGLPWKIENRGYNNYAAVWLNSTNTGLAGNASIGTLYVTIPTNATSLSSYAIHFDHASASPNGIASFPKQTLTGLITLSSRTNSYYSDGIPDSWRLRYFGTIYNSLSVSNADADGTGMNNWQKYVAGLNPTDPTSTFTAGLDRPSQQDCVIDWPSVSGKQYVIERSASLFPANWIPVSTNSGDGTIMEYHDTSGGGVRFYRVQVQ